MVLRQRPLAACGRDADRFRPELHGVAPLAESAARAYVVANHYSGSYPAALHRFGLWRGPRLVGVAVLGVRYAWAVGDRAQRRRTTMAMAPRPYPKHRDA